MCKAIFSHSQSLRPSGAAFARLILCRLRRSCGVDTNQFLKGRKWWVAQEPLKTGSYVVRVHRNRTKGQQVRDFCVYHLILASPATELQQSIAELAAAAHFWAMRSCKYSKVSQAETWQSKQFCLRNIVFIKDGNILDHTLARLDLADCVLITFK